MPDLFSEIPQNILPEDGEVIYLGIVLDKKQSDHYYERLLNSVDWKNDEAIVFGKRIVTKRQTAWYGDKPYNYTYSGIVRNALPWTKELIELKNLVEEKSGDSYNSCLLNLYPSGNEGVSWHSDDEKMLKKYGTVASLSFGATRTFNFQHKHKDLKSSVVLEHGSLLLMKGATQINWLHCIPKTTKVRSPRINLTFRTIIENS